MSLTMMAVRTCAVQALLNANTLVQDNVLDSQISPIDQTADGRLDSTQERPFIAVYTDASKAIELGQTGLRSNGQIELVLNYGISIAMQTTDKETGVSVVEGFPATDAYFEAMLDALDVQISRALVDPNNPWSQCFADFVQSYVSKEHLRSSNSFDKVRLAVGQTKIRVEVFADPQSGASFSDSAPWSRFMDLLREHDNNRAEFFERLLTGETDGSYPNYETLTSMSKRDAHDLKLYEMHGATLNGLISEIIIEEDNSRGTA